LSTAQTVGSPAAPARWTGLIGAGLRLKVHRRIDRLSDVEFGRFNTGTVQRGQLRGLLRRAGGTVFGRMHGFARLARLPDADLLRGYRAAVPVADWYAFKDHIARMREGGEPDVLWPGLVRDFAQTSGTTAGDKYIPVSREMMRSNFNAAMDIFANLARFGVPLTRLTSGKCLFLGGSTDVAANEHGIRTGDLSGLVTPMIRWPLSEIFLPGRDIALMNDWPGKIDAMARLCLNEDVRMINGMPSWASVLFERMLELSGRGTIRELWPNLEVFVHGGVRYGPFAPRVRQFWSGSPDGDDIPTRLELYPASEGFIAVQDEPNSREGGQPGLRLNTEIGLFFEFVPLESIDDSNPRAFAADEVDKGQRYVVVLSTCAGLWRYVLGDVVEFQTVPARLNGHGGDGPARLRIVGRHRHFVNAFGENLIVEHIEEAVAAAAREAGVVVGEFTAAPVYPAPGKRAGLELAVEVQSGNERLGAFGGAFDRALKRVNVDYTTKRTADLGMVAPTVTPVPVGTFHCWMASKGKLGGQHKCPRCANHREIIDAVISAANLG
jgi:hypothetical protein